MRRLLLNNFLFTPIIGTQQLPQPPGAKASQVIFLGGLLLDSQIDAIEAASKVVVQHAANALQKAFIRGLLENNIGTTVVNLPFVASFPRGDRRAYFPATDDVLFGKAPVIGKAFSNFPIVREYTRYRAALTGIKEACGNDAAPFIVVYSAHLPFIHAALAMKKQRPGTRVCLILPDFIEFMGQTGWLRKAFLSTQAAEFYRVCEGIDYFVTLTEHMAKRLKLIDRYVVIEGIFDGNSDDFDRSWPAEGGPVFAYTGTLASRYGIMDLLSAFAALDIPTARLRICGDGDARPFVEAAANQDKRITFYGQVSRPQALKLQAESHIVVNPRPAEGEYTKYSFPSKTMEYLASGRPIVMHFLPGMPDEYRHYLTVPKSEGAAGLADAMRLLASMPGPELRAIGAKNREFVLREKSPKAQVEKMVAAFLSQSPGQSIRYAQVAEGSGLIGRAG